MSEIEILKELSDMIEYCEKGKEFYQAINRLIVKIELTINKGSLSQISQIHNSKKP